MVLVDLVHAPFATVFVEPVKTCVVSRARKLLPILIPARRKWVGFSRLHGRCASRDIAVNLHGGGADFASAHSNHKQKRRRDMTRLILRGLAARWSQLNAEIRTLDTYLKRLIEQVAPAFLTRPGIGPEVASTLLVAAGDNSDRLRNERSFAALCGVAPLDASSGRQQRHRLTRGGNRNANRALWVIAFVRWRMHPETKAYAAWRMSEGRTKLEILRCIKRYIAREVFKLLRTACVNMPHATPA